MLLMLPLALFRLITGPRQLQAAPKKVVIRHGTAALQPGAAAQCIFHQALSWKCTNTATCTVDIITVHFFV